MRGRASGLLASTRFKNSTTEAVEYRCGEGRGKERKAAHRNNDLGSIRFCGRCSITIDATLEHPTKLSASSPYTTSYEVTVLASSVTRKKYVTPVSDLKECAVPRAGAGDGVGGGFGQERRGAVDAEYAHEVGAQVRDDDVRLRRVDDRFVGMGGAGGRGWGLAWRA